MASTTPASPRPAATQISPVPTPDTAVTPPVTTRGAVSAGHQSHAAGSQQRGLTLTSLLPLSHGARVPGEEHRADDHISFSLVAWGGRSDEAGSPTPTTPGCPLHPHGTLPLVSRRKRWLGHCSKGLRRRESAGDSQLPISQQLQMSRVPSTGAQLQWGGSIVTAAPQQLTPTEHLCPPESGSVTQPHAAPELWDAGGDLPRCVPSRCSGYSRVSGFVEGASFVQGVWGLVGWGHLQVAGDVDLRGGRWREVGTRWWGTPAWFGAGRGRTHAALPGSWRPLRT